MVIPASFVVKASRQFGGQGAAWARDLPSLVERCIDAWKLRGCAPIDDLSINFVCMCTSDLYGEAVLKIQGPHSERYTEIEALQIFDGRSCCRILALDMELAAMLLQRVRPGAPLRALKDRDLQLSIGADMIRRLPVAPPAGHHLPAYIDWLDTVGAMLVRAGAPRDLHALLQRAREQYGLLIVQGEPHVLLHGDLHHDNILRGGGGQPGGRHADGDGWLAIDPQGVIGPRVMETGRFIQNHAMGDYLSMDWPEVERTTGEVSRLVHEPYVRVLRALFVLHGLSIVWDWQMNVDQERLEGGEGQCKRILQAIEESAS